MNGFVATAPTTDATILSSGDWYPSIDLADARAICRIDGTVTEPRLAECLALAMSAVEDQLDAWQQQQVLLGRATLADVPSKQIGDKSRLVRLYERAVYTTAQAELIERYRDTDTTHAGNQRADTLDPTIDGCRRNVRFAIRDILGRPRSDVELI